MQKLLTTSDKGAPSSPAALAPDYDGHNMVFIVGSPRSGTTWLQRLLSMHPQIRTGQESHVFAYHIGPQMDAWRKLANPRTRGGVGLACYFTEESFLRIVKGYLLTLIGPMIADLGANELFLEKTPSHALFLREIFELLPRTRVIHVLRDARDVVSSLLSGDEWLAHWAPKNAANAASFWCSHVRAVREFAPGLSSEQFHEVRYEDLSHSPAAVLQGCAEFLGLKWDPTDIAGAVDANRASKARANGGGTPIPLFGEIAKRSGPTAVEPKGFIRKAKPGSWKDDLGLYQQLRVWRIAHREMKTAGYRWSRGTQTVFSCVSALADLIRLPLRMTHSHSRY